MYFPQLLGGAKLLSRRAVQRPAPHASASSLTMQFLSLLLFFFLYHSSIIFAFLNSIHYSQFPLSDTILPATENLTSDFASSTTPNITMAEHDGFRTVAYFVNWVQLNYDHYFQNQIISNQGNRQFMAAIISLRIFPLKS